MIGMLTGARCGLRWAIFLLACAVAIVAVSADPADARSRRKKRVSNYHPPYAAIVVDANSGHVLHAANADSLRHPASVTKVMTLYLLFEQIEAGKFKLDTDLPVSAHAASMSPSKLGLRPGQRIEVEDAIKALVTKSANDVAVVVAEAIGGSEEDFAEMMTRKARALGMSRTVYANASGLPDSDQVTTAREQAILGRAIRDRFPKMFRYFATNTFHYRGRAMRNHNRLLGQVDGVDGIKTGYVRASGFNLLASMRRDGRYLVAVVMGGPSGRSRDARMRQLLESNVRLASVGRTAPLIAEAASSAPRRPQPAPVTVASAVPAPVMADERLPPPAVREVAEAEPPQVMTRGVDLPAPRKHAEEGSSDPIKPILVRTVAVQRGVPKTAAVAPPERKEVAERAPQRAPNLRSGWVIQVGAYPGEDEAKSRLKTVQGVARSILASAEPFTERVVKRDATLYRARFAGLDRDEAEAACKYLKRNDIACLAIKN
jgi:D-alanyl-D-alanine carboxypeptidase